MLDMREVVGYTDWFVLMTGRNTRQTQAIAEEIALRLKNEDGLMPQRREGQREGTWILLDYLDAIVHVFTEETREYYRLDQLWGQVPIEAFEAKTA
jgi:ribosome-associated protein